MARYKKKRKHLKSGQTSGAKQAISSKHKDQYGDRCPSLPSLTSSMEESSQSEPVVVEPVGAIEMTDITPRFDQTTPTPRVDSYCSPSSEGITSSSPSMLESRCLKVTFNPEKHQQLQYNGSASNKEVTLSGLQQHPSHTTTPSKDDILSVVIAKLTELVNDSEKKQSQSSSERNFPSGMCGSSGQDGDQKSGDPFQKCPRCPCIFTPGSKQLRSKHAALCDCCKKAQPTIECGAGDGRSSNEEPAREELTRVRCELCSHVAGSYKDLFYHLLSEHRDAKVFKCKLCDFFTTVEARIFEHAAVHNARRAYKCNSCPFVTDKLVNLQGHMKNHNKDRELLLKCSECGFSCRCEDVLRTHMWEHIPSVAKPRDASSPAPTISLDDRKSALVSSSGPFPALPADGEQPYIFKCLLCGYLCDRLATLKAHAWRHAGEKGCSYPVVDEDEFLKQSLCSTTPAASKLFPRAITKLANKGSPSRNQDSSTVNSSDKEMLVETPSIKVTCGCCHKSREPQESASSCQCDGINIPPSTVPLIKELLYTKTKTKQTSQTNPNDSECNEKADHDSTSLPGMENLPVVTESPNLLEANPSLSIKMNELPHELFTVSDSHSDSNVHVGKQSVSDLLDPQLLIIEQAFPNRVVLGMDIPEPATIVEAITEHVPSVALEPIAAKDGALDKPANMPSNEQPSVVEEPLTSNSDFSKHAEDMTERNLQIASEDPNSDCVEKSSQHVNREIWENLTDLSVSNQLGRDCDSPYSKGVLTDSESGNIPKIQSGSAEVAFSSVEPPPSLAITQSASTTNRTPRACEDSEKTTLDDTCELDILKSQGNFTGTLLSKESALPIDGATEVQNRQDHDSVASSCLNVNTTLQIDRQRKQEQADIEVTVSAAGLKRHADDTSGESCQRAKRVCHDDIEETFTEGKTCHSSNSQGINSQCGSDAQLGSDVEQEQILEEKISAVDVSPEEDGIAKFFMNVLEDSEEPFQCKLCNKTYETYPLLRQHLQMHLVHNSFRCPLCKECYESLDNLQHHIQKHYQESHHCPECPAFCHTEVELETHMKSHAARTTKFKCEMCDESFLGQSECFSHQETVHGSLERSEVRCTHCGEGFSNTNTLLLHTLSCTVRKMQRCKECTFLSETTEGLQDHVRDCHVKAKFYKCSLCDYKSSAKNGIKNHMKFHSTDRPYKCQLCSFTGAYPQSLRSHMRMHNQPDWRPDCLPSELPEQYRCRLCCYTCNYLPSLKSHMWRHASDPNYSYKGKTPSNTATTSSVGLPAQSSPLTPSKHQGPSMRGSPSTQAPLSSEIVLNLVTFCCQECGFKSTDRNKLIEHLKTHIVPEASGVKE